MGLRVSSNVDSVFAQNRVRNRLEESSDVIEKMAAGSRITRAAHDPSGLSVAARMSSDARSMERAIQNGRDGASLNQTAEGYLSEVSAYGARMKELAIQSASDTLSDNERAMINLEFDQLKKEASRISSSANYNGIKLFDGKGEELEFQIGIRNLRSVDRLYYNKEEMSLTQEDLGMDEMQIDGKENAQQTIDDVGVYMEKINSKRIRLGGFERKLSHVNANLETSKINVYQSKSQIMDLDFAQATADKVRFDITADAAVSTLTQANSSAKAVLKLIG